MAADAREKSINIKDLVIDVPEKLKPREPWIFDPKDLITDEIWNKLINHLASLDKYTPNWSQSYSAFAYSLKLLNPERFTTLNFRSDHLVNNDKSNERLLYLRDIKVLEPNKLRLSKNDEKDIADEFNKINNSDLVDIYLFNSLSMAAAIKTLKPGLAFNHFEERGMIDAFSGVISSAVSYRAAEDLARIRIANLAAFDTMAPKKRDWEKYKSYFRNAITQSSWHGVSLVGANIKVLAAENVYIDDDGLYLEMHSVKSATAEVTTLPVVKRF